MLPMPYFMKNEDWYYFDDDEHIAKLTDKAPPEAVKSYNERMKLLEDISKPHIDPETGEEYIDIY